jgi:hypothetical protein
MEVICLEDAALYKLIEEVVGRLKEKTDKEKQNKWLTPAEAMQMLNIKRTTLQNLRDTGKIRYSQPQRKIILYDKDSILEYLGNNAMNTF